MKLKLSFPLLILFFISQAHIVMASSENTGKDSLSFSNLYIPLPFPKADPVLARLDSLTNFTFSKSNEYFGNVSTTITSFDPKFSDEEVKRKMTQIPSLFPLLYNNEVKTYINYFTQVKRSYTSRMLGLGEIYFPIFEEMLDKKGLPLELKYLPVIESAFNPVAVSRAGATGMWQIMFKTGRGLGLDMNSYIDQRMDPIRSTEAALNYLAQLYSIYSDWQLALAAYNAGPGNVNKAIANAGGIKNFWAIRPFLPVETQNYVPSFIGVVYAMHHAKDYKIQATKPIYNPTIIDTVILRDRVTLQHISNTIGIPYDELHFLNPSLKLGIIPSSESGFALKLPLGYIARFEEKRNAILNDPSTLALEQDNSSWTSTIPQFVTHIVKSGESITMLAAKYACTVADIKYWNNLKSTTIYKGQKIKIESKESSAKADVIVPSPNNNKATTPPNNSSVKYEEVWESVEKTVTHIVQSGESWYSISQKHGVDMKDLMKWNQNIGKMLYKGQKLAIKKVEKKKVLKTYNTGSELSASSGEPSSGIKYVLHTVQKEETIYSICRLYNCSSVENIIQLNKLANSEITPGQVLKIQI